MILRRSHKISILLCASFAVLLGVRQVSAGPVTNGQGVAPFSRLSLYEGVVSVVPPAGGQGVLELGYRGEEIAGSSDIYLRPGSVSQANGARICTNCGSGVNANYANLVIPGNVCLYGPTGLVADCKSVWPTGGAGASAWEYVTDGFIDGGGSTQYLQPNAPYANLALHIGSAAAPVNGLAFQVGGGNGMKIRNANGSGKALSVQGDSEFWQTRVAEQIRVNGQQVFDDRNSGQGSGLDADTLDNRQVTLESGAACADSGNGYGRAMCLCFVVYENPASLRKCIALSNHTIN